MNEKRYAIAATLVKHRLNGGIDIDTVSIIIEAQEPGNAMHRAENSDPIMKLSLRGYSVIGMALTEIQ